MIKQIINKLFSQKISEEDIECAIDENIVDCDHFDDDQDKAYVGVPAPVLTPVDDWFSGSYGFATEIPITEKQKDYMDHIMSIKDDPHKLMAHIYVRHMGDLSGGQMIKKRIPGEGRLYMFTDPDSLKTAIRSKLNDNMADEAKICFEYATELFKEMHNETE